jgi:hypothetical protein
MAFAALALMFLDSVDEAHAFYVRHRDQKDVFVGNPRETIRRSPTKAVEPNHPQRCGDAAEAQLDRTRGPS